MSGLGIEKGVLKYYGSDESVTINKGLSATIDNDKAKKKDLLLSKSFLVNFYRKLLFYLLNKQTILSFRNFSQSVLRQAFDCLIPFFIR